MNEEALKTPGLEQYSIARFAESFQIIGRHLIENAGMKFNIILPDLVSGNKDKVAIGVDVLVNFTLLRTANWPQLKS